MNEQDKTRSGVPKGLQNENEVSQNAGGKVDPAGGQHENPAEGSKSRASKKKSKRKKVKDAINPGKKGEGETEGESAAPGGSSKAPEKKLTGELVEQLLESNPALQNELSGVPPSQREEMLKEMNLTDLLTGLAIGGKDKKDMASYKFWNSQPVPRFDDKPSMEEGPIKIIDREKVSKVPQPLIEGFEWVTMDLTAHSELKEVFELLTYHYVEDDDASFRFKYSEPFFNWALKSPGWTKEWHIGVRVKQTGKLVAFISGVPMRLRVRSNKMTTAEINFLCVHKKLRQKRLTPVLIQEITRRCYLADCSQAIYTAGVVLPKPVASCRYYHRSLNWTKLNEVGFAALPPASTKARQLTKYKVPPTTSTNNLRPMQRKDAADVQDLLNRYLAKFDIAPDFSVEEIEHWLLDSSQDTPDQVVWCYVVEEPETHKITDFFSFYSLESSVIKSRKHDVVRAAYLFYYATETDFVRGGRADRRVLKARLNALIADALIVAKQYNFDVMNALTLLDNPLFLENQKFGKGDGSLHYYLYNYRAAPIAGGLDARGNLDERNQTGVGVVML